MLGGDAIGEQHKSSEVVGTEAAENLLKETDVKATIDVHLADMLIPYVALANGSSTYLIREITDHIDTNIWLTEKILDTKFKISKVGNLNRIEKI
jgi:RNA 3'-terminal phosphate cyclase (ATP)